VEPPAGFPLPAGLPLVKITDFGLALLVDRTAEAGRLTQTGMAIGTPMYMAPEQFAGSDVDCRADIYALGATVIHLLSGQPPFAGNTIWDIMVSKNSGELPGLRELATKISADSVTLISEMMATDVKARLGTYQDVLVRIDRLATVRSGPPTATAAKQ